MELRGPLNRRHVQDGDNSVGKELIITEHGGVISIVGTE